MRRERHESYSRKFAQETYKTDAIHPNESSQHKEDAEELAKRRNPSPPSKVEAVLVSDKGEYGGVYGVISVWRPHVDDANEDSASFLQLSCGQCTIEAGWEVNPKRYGDQEPHLYGYWRDDANNGCHNHQCGGFNAVAPNLQLGSVFSKVSTYGRNIIEMTVDIQRGKYGWVLYINQKVCVGYWPYRLFRHCNEFPHAQIVRLGGRISNGEAGVATTAEMGSGHRLNPDANKDSSGKVAYIRSYSVYDSQTSSNFTPDWSISTTIPDLYGASTWIVSKISNDASTQFLFFGGSKPE